MKINSELPNCMLDKNNELNEYDFVLFHLYISNEAYRNYYLNQRKKNPDRLMILDNSAYEFFVKGEKLDIDQYVNAIIELKPDMYILPDVLMDKESTIKLTKEFLSKYSGDITHSSPLAVAQGLTVDDMLDCLNIYNELNINNIAIPFHNKFFKELGENADQIIDEAITNWHNDTPNATDDMLYAMGRVQFMSDNYNLIRSFEYVHLLGSHDPIEKIFYSKFDSMDTGYPVKCALSGWGLGEEPKKPEIIIDEFLDKDIPHNIQDLISSNIKIFKALG